ncbi:IS5 family transposase [Candidatus Bandiella woodruffii]|uniref:IS5 family transposase n=1 Tax=Candidatus Bandiella euplotis TaxID=1664265 RepID=A0ABZ0UJ72_9RICK|nr:hypothetical protein [Candidatus Bandiella woodruffii]WPX96141.1 IS5 family transposase [Candidatus Bandiella woodruffii]
MDKDYYSILKFRVLAKDRYKIRHIVENTFLHLKRWRGIATR